MKRDPATKPVISKYARKVALRQPPTLLGQRLMDALNAKSPGGRNTEASQFCNPTIKTDLQHEQYTHA